MPNFFSYELFEIPIYRYLLFFGILFLALLIRKLFDRYISKLLVKWTKKTEFEYDDQVINAIISPMNILFIIAGLFFALSVLNIPTGSFDLQEFLLETLKVIISVIFVWIFFRLCTPASEILQDLMAKSDKELAAQFGVILKQTLRVSVVLIGGILIVQNMGYSVGSLLAGLGVGGLAIALAAQDTVANLFGTIVMFTDRPFSVGDWVQFRDVDGTVESIGFRSTRVRTWEKSLKVIPNKLLTSEIIENWSQRPVRRVNMRIGLTYDSPPEKIKECVERIKEILRNDDGVKQDYMLVYFTDFGASDLSIFIYYFTQTTIWAEYLEIRQRVNLEIMKLVQEMGLSFAFPSQSVYFSNKFYESGMGRGLE
jgi:MscS family membrane protein